MLQRDYIMRMIEQLSTALVRILKLKETQKFEEAEIEILQTTKSLLGFDMNFVRKLSTEGLIALFKQSDALDAGKCIILAELLKAEGEICEIQKRTDQSYQSYVKSLALFLQGLINNTQYRTKHYFTKTAFLINKINVYELSGTMHHKLFHYFKMSGDYAQAENIIFHLIDLGELNIVEQGISFYTCLLEKSDEELVQGRLPREEVEEGLRILKSMLPS